MKASTSESQGMASSSHNPPEPMINKDITPHPSADPISPELQSAINTMFQSVTSPLEQNVVNEPLQIITPDNPWNTLFTGNRLAAKDTSLKFIAPAIKNGSSVACLDKSETDKLSEIWVTSLVIYIVGVTPSIGAITRFIEKGWNSVAKPTIFLHDNGFLW